MRSGSIYNKGVIEWITQKKKRTQLTNFYVYFSTVRNLIEEKNQGTKTPSQVTSLWGNKSGSALSNLVQKHLGAPAQDFANKNRYGSFIENCFLEDLKSGKQIKVQSEHPMERQYIHEKIGQLLSQSLCEDYIPNPKKISDLKPVMALISSLYVLKDDIAVVTLESGKGIGRYNDKVIVCRNIDGSYVTLSENQFHDSICLPLKRITDICLNDYFIPMLKCEISFDDVNELFVNKTNALYNLWYQYTEIRRIDRNQFPSPLLITPAFF